MLDALTNAEEMVAIIRSTEISWKGGRNVSSSKATPGYYRGDAGTASRASVTDTESQQDLK